MTYQQALAFVEETKKYGSILGLDSIRALMKELGDVQEDLSTIHIAGTNGKCITFAFHYSIFKFRSLQDLSCWWAQVDSNHRPHAYQACALTT